MALTDTGKDIQVIIGTGVPRASDMVYGGIAIDEPKIRMVLWWLLEK